MKTKLITGGKVDILLVDIGLIKNYIRHKDFLVLDNTYDGLMSKTKKIDNDDTNGFYSLTDWKFISVWSKLSEERAADIFYEENIPYDAPDQIEYFKLKFHSLLQTNGVLSENPYGEETDEIEKIQIVWKRQEAEANVFNPATTLIFAKY